MDDFTIDKISWHSKLDNSPEFQARLRQRFITLCSFLSANGLLKESLNPAPIEEGKDFEIKASHLTTDGLALMKSGYSKWLKSLDRGKEPQDTGLLLKELTKIQNK
jgi:hypothetical protein